MKTLLIVISIIAVLFIAFQIYTAMSINKTETQAYKVIRVEEKYEVRYYPSAMMAMVFSKSKSYQAIGSSGFGKLAKFIFGGNNENKQIPMTSPVHMEIGDTVSSMAFVMPNSFNKDNLPKPNNSEIAIKTSEAEYVAAIRFGGFANAESIDKYKAILEAALKQSGLAYYGNFRVLGYNPPYQLLNRRNEIIVTLNANNFK